MLDLTSFDAALKQHYTSDRIENMVYEENPLLALLPKMEDFGGRNLPIPTIWGNPQGRSQTFTTAQARGLLTQTQVSAFLLTRVHDYSIAYIDNETIEASKGNANAFLEASTLEIDGAINSLTRSIAIAAYRAGFGRIGAISGAPGATTTLVLTDPQDVTNFEVGMSCQFAQFEGSAALRAGGATLQVVAVDRSAGTLTMSANLNTIAGLADQDSIFASGDRQDVVGPARLKIAGLDAWVPATAPTATLFFGVDRSLDTSRLGGIRFDGSALTIEEALIAGAARAGREGAKIDHYFVDFEQWENLEKSLGAKVQYVDLEVGTVGFRGIRINGPKGEIKVVPDQNALHDVAFGLTLKSWKMYSLGKMVRVIDTDGLTMLRQAAGDGVEVRYGFYGNMGCNAPGHNIRVTL